MAAPNPTANYPTIQPVEQKGFLLLNPDSQANMHLAKVVDPNTRDGWGQILTPAEIRMYWMMGNGVLTGTSGDFITDEMLMGVTDLMTRALANTLQWDIYPTMYRHRPYKPEIPRVIGADEEWDDAYKFESNGRASNFFTVMLRHRPLIRVEKFELREPFNESRILDLLPGADISYKMGILRTTRALGFVGGNVGSIPLRSRGYTHGFPRQRIPNSYYVDYACGYESARRVPDDLKLVIAYYVIINLLSAYGEGISSGLSAASLSLGTISESFSTTASATSAWFGARIEQLSKEVKSWWDLSSHKYRKPQVGIL